MRLVSIFNQIRDIPFRIPLALSDQSYDCSKKHKKLYELFKREGLKVRFRSCSFLWSSLPITKDILNIKHEDTCEHLYLEVFINNKWITLDATWDIKLKSVFDISIWDGLNNTSLAVKPLEIFPLQEDERLKHSESVKAIEKDIRDNGKFYLALNDWLNNIRNSKR